MACIQMHDKSAISDSSKFSVESAILRFSAITARNEKERPKMFETGSIIFSCLDANNELSCK